MEVGAKNIVYEEPLTNIELASSDMNHKTLLMIENESLKKENAKPKERLRKKFEQELENSHKSIDFKCDFCSKCFTISTSLKNHIRYVHEGKKKYKCNCCEKRFATYVHLKRHINEDHNGQKTHKCDSCGKSFTLAGELKQHVQGVHEINNCHQCDSCGNSFSTKQTLRSHIITMHSQILGPLLRYQAQIDQNCLKSEKLEDKDHKCKPCGKLFSTSRNLRIHFRTKEHNINIQGVYRPRPLYHCNSCDKSFNRPKLLKIHIQAVHEGRKDYKCESCSKSFSAAGNLKKHIHTVHEVRTNYKCESKRKQISSSTF